MVREKKFNIDLQDGGHLGFPIRMILATFDLFVPLSLLTMTNPNQLCDVLSFVCSKMGEKTNLSSKLPVADTCRTRVV